MRIVIGVDSGGSKTRALAIGLDGTRAGYAEAGGGHPGHNENFAENVQEAISGACGAGGPQSVAALVAGIAGLDRPKDHEWAEKATALPGIAGTRLQVNDAEIAHYGALEGKPGIICVQGHGSMVMGKTESGRLVRNYDLFHYARCSGPQVGSRAAQVVISGGIDPTDAAFTQAVLQHWGVTSVEELRELAMSGWRAEHDEAWRTAGRMAPIVTELSDAGSPTAARICQAAASEIADGVKMLGVYFSESEIDVCLSGSCGRSPAIGRRVAEALAASREKTYRLVDPKLTPVQGAALWALRSAGIEPTEAIICRLLSA